MSGAARAPNWKGGCATGVHWSYYCDGHQQLKLGKFTFTASMEKRPDKTFRHRRRGNALLWALPGGYTMRDEDGRRVLTRRTEATETQIRYMLGFL